MASFQDAITNAVKTQAARKDVSNGDIAGALGISRQMLWRYLNHEAAWNSDQFPPLAKVLGLESEWALFDLAKQEAVIAQEQAA
ncbi:hypothetical protein [Bifidobacterium moukalabense]|uniref:hypothetical protein n=1 Tax=Bifidobacterium moukalabense TaxID=1333651 RepID=UPI0010F4AD65|nr:hypothetical protein [Bifidobacterium moukalabense]